MLPQVIDEQHVFTFKFWFGAQILIGMHFQNELFCQIATTTLNQRSQAYQRACKLTQNGIPIIITCTPQDCHIWGSLRDDTVKQLLLNPQMFRFDRLSALDAIAAASSDRDRST